MNLSSFQKDKSKKQIIIAFSILVVLLVAGIILYRTYSLFEETGEYDVIKGSVPTYLDNYDVKVNFKVEGQSVSKVPERNSGKGVESIVCDKGAVGNWNYFEWNFNVQSLSNTKTTCTVNFVNRYTEDILNGTDPVLKDGLIPVTIENDGIVKKADIQSEWYDYESRQWANAVILNDESIRYGNGEVIPENNIESYFVWIPRYQYKIFDMGNYTELTSIENKPQVIDVVFGLDTTTDSDSSCKTPMESGESGRCNVGKYMTHPSFISFQSTGIWVGKFETGYKDANSVTEAQQNVNNSDKIQIKPNVYSWRGINVSNAYFSSYNYKRNLDSHMMKNTEWGSVAYLQHSRYGSGSSVRFNNNEIYLTGYSAVHEPTIGYSGGNVSCSITPNACNEYGTSNEVTRPWNTDIGYLASTTGNISGIYDMSGGAFEYLMGVMSKDGLPCSGRDEQNHSGFNGPYCNTTGTKTDGIKFLSNLKYYDIYSYSDNDKKYNRRILGDATGEIGPFSTKTYNSKIRQVSSWYADESSYIHSGYPWFIRGGHWARGSDSGMFAFDRYYGSFAPNGSYRIILSI